MEWPNLSIVSLIAAIDAAGGLGLDGQLLCHLPADLEHFKALTVGKPVVMGRKTFQSIGRALPYRSNIVLSHSPHAIDGVEVVSSLEQALEFAHHAPEIMIIGGAGVYQQALAFAQRLYITRIMHTFAADVFFPTVNWSEWRLVEEELHAIDKRNPFAWSFNYYERNVESVFRIDLD